jgi:hypothetical protein
MNKTNLEKIADLLNEALALDRPAVAALIANRVPCNEALADHPTIQVGVQHGGFHVGLLGLLNGLGEPVPEGGERLITAVFEDSDDLIGTMIEDIEPIKVKYTPDQALNTLFSFS